MSAAPPTCGCSHVADRRATHVLAAAVAVTVVLLLLFLAVGVAGVHICGDEVAAMWDLGFQGWRRMPVVTSSQ